MDQIIQLLQNMIEGWEFDLEEDRTYLAAGERGVIDRREGIAKTEGRIAEAKQAIALLRKP